jgi:hypothetical protein
MPTSPRNRQLQIRISDTEKAELRRRARRAGMGMSAYVLSCVFPSLRETFQELLTELVRASRPGPVLAELNDLLTGLTAGELALATEEPPRVKLSRYLECYVAAMVELAAHRTGAPAPRWTENVPALEQPAFGSSLESLRLHLLRASPPPFRRRNVFIDASIGDRV